MIAILDAIRIAYDATLEPKQWSSIVINKRKPHTYRAFLMQGDSRICLHRFEACKPDDAFPHPHPWPSSMLVLSGDYEMIVGHTPDLENCDPASVIKLTLGAGSTYEMTERQTWHQVIPRSRCYSLMVNGPRWDNAHSRAPSTGGKGLSSMPETLLAEHLASFRERLEPYVESTTSRSTEIR